MNYIRGQARGITSETGRYRRVRFRSCGTLGYGPTLNKKGVDIQCNQVSRYDGEHLVNYVGNNVSAKGEGRGEPFSCSLRRGRPIGKVLVHWESPKCYQ